MANETNANPSPEAAKAAGQPVKLDTSQLKSSYCNIANVSSTREEVILNFGVNKNWDLGQKEMEVELLHRIILSPFAAKRMQAALTKLIEEYESRYGALK